MAGSDRKSLLCEQTRLTGIDFIQIVHPTVQTVLRVFFCVEPSVLDEPMVERSTLFPPISPQEAGPPVADSGLVVHIVSVESGREIKVTGIDWRLVHAPAGVRLALEVTVAEPGDFSIHRLTIEHPLIDPFFNGVVFSFKQGCPSSFDCRTDCEPEIPESSDYPVDYLARDFWSFRRMLLDLAAARYPMWSEPIEADQAVMMFEIMAALGDEFAYTQDRYACEASLETATQRNSRSTLARLVDYIPDPGTAAETELAVWVTAGGAEAVVGARVWAMPEGHAPIPFSVRVPVWHHAAWNEISLHVPDSDAACLPQGSVAAYLATTAPTIDQLPSASGMAPDEFWKGRRAILRSHPNNPAEPERAFAVTLTGVSAMRDELTPHPGPPTEIIRITWTEPTPWPLPLADTSVLLNIVTVVAGEEIVERFRIGSDSAIADRFPGLNPDQLSKALALPRAIEREGPFEIDRHARSRILRYGLRDSEMRGLGWTGARDPLGIGSQSDQKPMLTLAEVVPPDYNVDRTGANWIFFHDLLGADLDTYGFTLDEGMWCEVTTHQTPFEDVVFQDYAGNAGWTLRFGDGAFGRPPENGAVMEARYFTAPGTSANLSHDSITQLKPPPGASPGALLDYASAVTNPLPITSGTDEETAENIRINAPEAFRALPLRAVRSEDYGAIIERLDWVQRSNSKTRWTGSWSTDFVAADPVDGFALSTYQRTKLVHVIDCVRQTGRDARVADADYLDIDLEIEICVSRYAYPGEVIPRVEVALAAPGFFAPNNFTFGQPLRRSAIEAALQAMPGVEGVEDIRFRVRRQCDWQAFIQPELAVEPWQIIRLQNDPRFPGRGSLRVRAHGGAA
ncbi:hypothetical protein [Nitrosospira sp. Nsp13]|uniref:hypothetical protein n=1 Tax=Nitrosospira sp. Nsp13 TaxID=1855332 RepID=UPI0008827C36|nr:hypothetical protein [Nitrosospira sp. Nsp13]SCX79734.1 putative baseplate assembly protein [Nitrosospira sp. Nsp13]